MSRGSAEPIGGGLSRTASTKTTSLGRRLPAARALRYRLRLAGELGAALHRNGVQLVILNDAPALLAQRALSRGVLVFQRSRAARVRFHVATAHATRTWRRRWGATSTA